MKTKLLLALIFLAIPPLARLKGADQTPVVAPAESLQATLTAKERQKWDAFRTGPSADIFEMFADDFVSIGYKPGPPPLTVEMTTKREMLLARGQKSPPAEFRLSDFQVMTPNGETAIVTYKARGTENTPPGPEFVIHATSVWVKRGEQWLTIFYQATLTR